MVGLFSVGVLCIFATIRANKLAVEILIPTGVGNTPLRGDDFHIFALTVAATVLRYITL